jgi:hypothetical protein
MTTMEIPNSYFVYGCDLDAKEPYCIICPVDSYGFEDEIKVLIPKQLASYLTTSWCGSQKMHDNIVDDVKNDIKNGLFNLLGLNKKAEGK